MKKKEKQQIMQKKPKELETLIGKKRREIALAQLKKTEEKNKNSIRSLKKELAVMLTALREQQIVQEIKAGGTTQ